MDDQQRARELLAAEWDRDGYPASARNVREAKAPEQDRAVRAITAALRAAPDGFVIVRSGAVKPSNCGADHHHCCRTCGADLGGIAARPQGVKDA